MGFGSGTTERTKSLGFRKAKELRYLPADISIII